MMIATREYESGTKWLYELATFLAHCRSKGLGEIERLMQLWLQAMLAKGSDFDTYDMVMSAQILNCRDEMNTDNREWFDKEMKRLGMFINPDTEPI